MGMKKNNAQVKILEKKMSESIGDKCAPASSLVLSKSRSRVIRFSCRYLSLSLSLPSSLSLSLSPLLPFKHVSHVARALYRRPCVYVYIYTRNRAHCTSLYVYISSRTRSLASTTHTLRLYTLARRPTAFVGTCRQTVRARAGSLVSRRRAIPRDPLRARTGSLRTI